MKHSMLAVAVTAAILAGPTLPTTPPKSVLQVHALANGDAELIIYGFIGEDFFSESNSASNIVQQLAGITASVIQVRINSQGGSVPDGLAIYNALKRHPARIVVTVDGQAMSIASLIVQAGDERVMGNGTLMMLHAPSAFIGGNAVQLRQYADTLDVWAKSMLSIYTARIPGKADDLNTLITDGDDHYFTAAEAVAFGLADTLLDAEAKQADESAAAAALLGYLQAISHAPATAALCLRRHIQHAAQPQLFASLPEATQRAVYAHIEDSTMRQKCLQIMAAAAGAQPAATPNEPVIPAASAPAPAATPAAGAPADPIAALQVRNESIRAAFAGFRDVEGVIGLEAECLADPRMTIEAAQQKLLAKVGAAGQPLNAGGGHVVVGEAEADKLREAGVNMLMARAGMLPQAEAERVRQSNPYLRSSLVDMAEQSLIRAGINTRQMTREQIATRVLNAQTTSDFPVLLENTLHKMLLSGYRLTPFTWTRFCATGTLADYRPHPRYHLSSFSDLKPVNEHGEYESGVLGDGEKETIQGSRKGRILRITPEVLVNDDLGAFSRPVVALGQAAGRTIEKDVYAALALNGGMGPTMQDGNALFHADHNNIAATAAAPGVDSWDAARQQLGSQMDPGGNDYLDIVPALWLGPLSLGTKARTINTSEFNPDVSSKYAPPNTSRGMVRDVIDTPRLSGTAWMLFADPAIEPVIEVAFLNGVQTPTIEQETQFSTDGLAWKVVHRYGVGGVGWRGAVRNAGA